MRSLKQLLAVWRTAVANSDLPQPPIYDGPDINLTRLTEKTSEVEPGVCFVARVRTTSDGHPYIEKAIKNGASMILAQRVPAEFNLSIPGNVVYLQVTDTAESLAWLAAAWEGFPSRHLVTIGITGTDGKTTIANILFEILKTAGIKVGLLSTVRAIIGDAEEPLALHVTTPEAPVVQRHLRRMVDAGLTHCILESTSIGLAQHRVSTVDFDIALITNITHEHLDYHGDFESYFAAKSWLFELVAAKERATAVKSDVLQTAVLNRDDPSYQPLRQIPIPHQLTYGIQKPADVYATNISFAPDQTTFTLHINLSLTESNNTSLVTRATEGRAPPHPFTVSSSLVGEFNIYNMLAAATVAHRLGVTPEVIEHTLHTIKGVNGRMQRIDRGQSFLTIVDFAHTPNALEKAIKAARCMTRGRIITLFGSAGKRDQEKRRLMAEISARDADLTVLTAEDPRTEPLEEILAMMADGCRGQGGIEGKTFWRIPDRGVAIYFTLTLAKPQDVVLICGKGHEQSMCFGAIEYPWDDRDATQVALDAFLADQPMPNLGLPTFSAAD